MVAIDFQPNGRLAGGKAYSISQLTAWTLYGVLQIAFSPTPRDLRIATVTAWCATGIIGTDLLRRYVTHRRWATVPQLVPAFAIAALVIAAAMNAASIAVSIFIFHDRNETSRGWLVVAHYMQAVLVVSVWCAVVLAANEVHRRRLAETEALRLALVAQVAQFRVLRSQLNPHFLFNCLNSLRELIDEDRDRAKQMIDLLSALLRYTLRADRVETVSLKEELRAVEDYLALEKVRFEERLRIRFDVDPQSLDTPLPPMLLQALAENGIKHGIAHLSAGGELGIATQLVDGHLRVEITNSGTLADVTGLPAVGLENTRERLRLMYGESASLTLTALDEQNVRARILIPLRHHTSDAKSADH